MSIHLHSVVHKLTNREKAYFNKLSKIHSEDQHKNYMKIYSVLEKMPVYDAEKFLNHFRGTNIEKYMSSELNYLKSKILISLFNFQLNAGSKNKITQGIIFTNMLFEKGFKKEALKRLKQTKKIAYFEEEFTSVLQLIELEEKILFAEGLLNFREVLLKLKKERIIVTDCINNLNDMRILRERVREKQFDPEYIKSGKVSFNFLEFDPSSESPYNCLSKKAIDHWYYIQTMMNYLLNNIPKALKNCALHTSFLTENLHLFPFENHISAYSNYLYMAGLAGSKEQFDLAIEMLTTSKIKNDYVEYVICSRSLSFVYIEKDIPQMREYLDRSLSVLSSEIKLSKLQRVNLLFQMTKVAVTLKDFNAASYALNLLKQEGTINMKITAIKIISCIIYQTLGWNQLLESELILLAKHRKSHQRDEKIIDPFLSYFKELQRSQRNKSELVQELQSALSDVIHLMNNITIDFDFHQWSLSLD